MQFNTPRFISPNFSDTIVVLIAGFFTISFLYKYFLPKIFAPLQKHPHWLNVLSYILFLITLFAIFAFIAFQFAQHQYFALATLAAMVIGIFAAPIGLIFLELVDYVYSKSRRKK